MKGPGPHGASTITPGIHTSASFHFEDNTTFGGDSEAIPSRWSVDPLTAANVGQTFTLDAADSIFQNFAARLTDGEIGTSGFGEDVLFFSLGVSGQVGGGLFKAFKKKSAATAA